MEKINLRQADKAFFISKENEGDTTFPIYYVTNFIQPKNNESNAYLECMLIGGYDSKANEYIHFDDPLLSDYQKNINSELFDFLDYNCETAMKTQGYILLNYNDTLNAMLAERDGKDALPVFEIENGVLKKYNGHDRFADIPKEVTEIGEKAFERVDTLEYVHMQNVKKIGAKAFAYCKNLERVSFNKTLEEIGLAAFTDCTKLKYINFGGNELPDTLTKIENYAFSHCESLERMSLPNVTVVPFGCFQGCTGLKKVTIDEGVVSIAGNAFWGCTSLEKVDVPSTLVDMGQAAFNKCTALQHINLPEKFDTAVLKYAELPQTCSYDCSIPDYSKYEGMTIMEFFKSLQGTPFEEADFDVWDNTFSETVCCCYPNFDISYADKDPCERFEDYIYNNVKIVRSKPDKDFVVADWAGFVEEHFDDLKAFTKEWWKHDYSDKDDFVDEWIGEIHKWLAGYTYDRAYTAFLKDVGGIDGGEGISKKEEKDLLSTVYGDSDLDLTEQTERGRS